MEKKLKEHLILKKIKIIKKQNEYFFLNKEFYLKIIRSNDVKVNYIKWMNDIEITKYTEQRHYFHTKKSIIKYIEEKFKSDYDLMFGIFQKKINNDIHIGNIKISIVNLHDQRADFSYLIGEKNFWGKGIATLSVNKMKKLSKKIGLKKITANCYSKNIGSIEVLKKNDFKIEGIHKKNSKLFKNRIDTYSLGIVL